MNAAYTKNYQNHRKQRMAMFCPECLCPHTEEIKLNTEAGGFILKVRHYKDINQYGTYHGSECELQNQMGKVFYRWYNINNDAEFYRLIQHSDGNDYLIFRQDLYGYSALNLQTMQDFHYLPAQSFPFEKKAFEETFIWTDAFYEPQSNLLAISGCFWARPYSVIVLDFSQPLKASEAWLDTHLLFDADYNIYDDFEFAGWTDGALVLTGFNCRTETAEKLSVPVNKLLYTLEKQKFSPCCDSSQNGGYI